MPANRTFVIGLDCVPPLLAFDRYLPSMPTLCGLLERGVWGPMRSAWPPITVPAWACMTTGRDPGKLGIYGFRNRVRGSYDLEVVRSTDVHCDSLWQILADHGKRCAALFVPPSYPPKPLRPVQSSDHPVGDVVSCFLTPSTSSEHTAPASLAAELEDRFGPYQMDVAEYRSEATIELFERIAAMTRQHFDVARYMWATKKPDFCMMVDIGPDRFHHAFWRFIDPNHRDYQAGHPFEKLGKRYYRLLDDELSKTLKVIGANTNVLVVSDHGAQPLQGGACLNEWLIQNNWLQLTSPPSAPQALRLSDVDWMHTRAWAEGGYYGRVFLNVKDREPFGVIAPDQIDRTANELVETLKRFPSPNGSNTPLRIEAHRPSELYREVQGFAPDVLVSIDNFGWRAIGSVGHNRLHLQGTDQGMDGCNHAMDGIFVLAGPNANSTGLQSGIEIYDVFATVLGLMSIERPAGTSGRDWSAVT